MSRVPQAAPKADGRVTGHWIGKARREALYERDGRACVYCQSPNRGLTLDHLRPRCKGGSNKSSNLVTACRTCNSVRGHASLRSFCLDIASLTNQDWRAVVARVRNQRSKKP